MGRKWGVQNSRPPAVIHCSSSLETLTVFSLPTSGSYQPREAHKLSPYPSPAGSPSQSEGHELGGKKEDEQAKFEDK